MQAGLLGISNESSTVTGVRPEASISEAAIEAR